MNIPILPLFWTRNSILDNEGIIVNAANSELRAGGGVCGLIHKEAGPDLENECKSIIKTRRRHIKTGHAVMTAPYNLMWNKNIKKVIHTVGPIWRQQTDSDSCVLLSMAYTNSLNLLKNTPFNKTTISFPLISTGIYGFPVPLAYKIAIVSIQHWLLVNPWFSGNVLLCAFTPESIDWFLHSDIEQK